MTQTWRRLLFAHWPLAPDVLRPLLPPQLTIDTFEGQAWLGVVPFDMIDVKFRDAIPMPLMSAFAELNVRTYVTINDKPGVWFFSLDAASKVAVRGARLLYHLPYMDADMRMTMRDETTEYESYRTHRHEPPAEFVGTYSPTSDVFRAESGSLEAWLTERYCLYAAKGDTLYRGEIHHARWPLQRAEADIRSNTMAQAAGITLPDTAPLLHYAERIKVIIWPLRRVTDA